MNFEAPRTLLSVLYRPALLQWPAWMRVFILAVQLWLMPRFSHQHTDKGDKNEGINWAVDKRPNLVKVRGSTPLLLCSCKTTHTAFADM